MCPADDSHLTLEFKDFFVICPSIQFAYKSDFTKNLLGEEGVSVKQGFEYNSSNNREWLTHEAFLKLLNE